MPGDTSEADRTVFVGNVDPLIKEEILYELFLQAGPVRMVTMARDREGRRRPFGFVLYKHAEAVPYAIALLNGISLYGRPLKLDFCTGSSQDPWGSFGSPGTEDKGLSTVRRGVCPQDSSVFNFSGLMSHGDCRPQEQITRGNAVGVCNWPPCQPSPLTPLAQHVVPNPYPGLFTSTPLQPWLGPFWTSPLTPFVSPAAPSQEAPPPPPPPPPPPKREYAPPLPKEAEAKSERDGEKALLPVKGRGRGDGWERPPVAPNLKDQEQEREKEIKPRKSKRTRSRKRRHQSRHKT